MNPRTFEESRRAPQAEAAKPDAATCLRLPGWRTGRAWRGKRVAVNPKELGYGG